MAEWDNAHLLVKGQDLTPTFGALASAVEQAIEQATTASWYGPIIYSEDTPPVTGSYVFNKRGLWQKISTKRWYYYNTTAGSWDNLENVLVLVVPDGSITLAKLSSTGADPLEVLRRNAAGTAFEWVSASSLLLANSIPVDRLENATGSGYHLLSDGSGIFVKTLFSNSWATQYANATKSLQELVDGSTVGIIDQVLALDASSAPGDPGPVVLKYADQLLRNNTVPTNKLQLSAGNIGKYPVVNGSATDFDWVTPSSTVRVATCHYGGAANTAPQAITTGAARNVNFNSESDPSSIVTLTSNQFTFAATGTYLIDVVVPLFPTSAGESKGHIIWRNVTDGADLATESFRCYNGANQDYSDRPRITYILTVSDIAKVYEVQIYASANTTLHTHTAAPNSGGYAEAYQRITITRLS